MPFDNVDEIDFVPGFFVADFAVSESFRSAAVFAIEMALLSSIVGRSLNHPKLNMAQYVCDDNVREYRESDMIVCCVK